MQIGTQASHHKLMLGAKSQNVIKTGGGNRAGWAGSDSGRIELGQFDSVKLSGYGCSRVGYQVFSVRSFQVSGRVSYRVI
jgi:hypothetical protein